MRGSHQITKKDGSIYTVRDNRSRFLYPDEWIAFYSRLKKSQEPTFKGLIGTGARINELRHVKVNDIDFERGNIVLRVTKRVVNNPRTQKHGIAKIRVLTISTEFAKYLKKIVIEYQLQPFQELPILTDNAANVCLKKTLKEIGVKDYDMISVHNIRKTLETWLLAIGVDTFKVVKHFGHSPAVALKHYVSGDIFNSEDKAQIREIIGDLFAKN